MKPLNHYLHNSKHFRNRLSHYREIATRTRPTQNWHVDCDVISGLNVETIVGYVAVNSEVASSSSFRDDRDKIIPDAEVGGGAGGINAICCEPEVADDVISGKDFSGPPCCKLSSYSLTYVTRWKRYVHLGPIFGIKKQKCMMTYPKQQMKHLNLDLPNSKPFRNQLSLYR